MNIFVLDMQPRVAAMQLNNKHCVKMLLESVQLLYGAHWFSGGTPKGPNNNPYKASFKNHPCSIWTRASLSNYDWLVQHTYGISDEYTFRYGKVHKCVEHLDWLNLHHPNLPDIGLTPFALAMPDDLKKEFAHDAVLAYRNYYMRNKAHLAKWTNRDKPEWWNV